MKEKEERKDRIGGPPNSPHCSPLNRTSWGVSRSGPKATGDRSPTLQVKGGWKNINKNNTRHRRVLIIEVGGRGVQNGKARPACSYNKAGAIRELKKVQKPVHKERDR